MDTLNFKKDKNEPSISETEHWRHLESSLLDSMKSLTDFEKAGQKVNQDGLLETRKPVQPSSLESLRSGVDSQCLKIKTDETESIGAATENPVKETGPKATVVKFSRTRSE